MTKKQIIVCLIISFFIIACSKEDNVLKESFVGFLKPQNFPEPTFNFAKNTITKEKFELGKRLFYDGILSRDNSISCASCHISYHGFTHHGHDVSHGIDDQVGTRNSMPLFNLAWNRSFFWDGGVSQLELTSVVPIQNHVEMDENFSNIVHKLKQHNEYPLLFSKAFGNSEINGSQVLQALAQFMVMLVSDQSRYDLMKAGKATFTTVETQGYTLFQTHCASCHPEPLFTDGSFRNNGLEISPTDDQGRYQITENKLDRYTFKVPSLRNLTFTAPYMHDGRFISLNGVINHYLAGIQATENLDPLLSAQQMQLKESEVQALLAFLNTLNDEKFITNPLYAE